MKKKRIEREERENNPALRKPLVEIQPIIDKDLSHAYNLRTNDQNGTQSGVVFNVFSQNNHNVLKPMLYKTGSA